MQLQSSENVTKLFTQSATPVIYDIKECFLFDLNFASAKYLFATHILTTIVNFVFSASAIGGNSIVIFSVWKTPSLQTPSNVFICCLAFSDLAVGLLTQPCFVVHKVGEMFHRVEMYCTTRMLLESLGNITTGTSVLTMTGIAAERWLALYFHLRYNRVLTCTRVLSAVACFWGVFVVFAVLRVSVLRPEAYTAILTTVIALCFLSICLAYIKILRCVKRHERQIQAVQTEVKRSGRQIEQTASRLRNMLRYKKSTIAMIVVVGFFTACFAPLMCVILAYKMLGYTTPVKTAFMYASTIAFLNSSLNPLVYCWRIRTLRTAIKTVLGERMRRKGI